MYAQAGAAALNKERWRRRLFERLNITFLYFFTYAYLFIYLPECLLVPVLKYSLRFRLLVSVFACIYKYLDISIYSLREVGGIPVVCVCLCVEHHLEHLSLRHIALEAPAYSLGLSSRFHGIGSHGLVINSHCCRITFFEGQ